MNLNEFNSGSSTTKAWLNPVVNTLKANYIYVDPTGSIETPTVYVYNDISVDGTGQFPRAQIAETFTSPSKLSFWSFGNIVLTPAQFCNGVIRITNLAVADIIVPTSEAIDAYLSTGIDGLRNATYFDVVNTDPSTSHKIRLADGTQLCSIPLAPTSETPLFQRYYWSKAYPGTDPPSGPWYCWNAANSAPPPP
jgi:hypothetical protein